MLFFAAPPFCESASLCILEVFDFFDTFVMVIGYWFLKIGKCLYGNFNEQKYNIYRKDTFNPLFYINTAMLEKKNRKRKLFADNSVFLHKILNI